MIQKRPKKSGVSGRENADGGDVPRRKSFDVHDFVTKIIEMLRLGKREKLWANPIVATEGILVAHQGFIFDDR